MPRVCRSLQDISGISLFKIMSPFALFLAKWTILFMLVEGSSALFEGEDASSNCTVTIDFDSSDCFEDLSRAFSSQVNDVTVVCVTGNICVIPRAINVEVGPLGVAIVNGLGRALPQLQSAGTDRIFNVKGSANETNGQMTSGQFGLISVHLLGGVADEGGCIRLEGLTMVEFAVVSFHGCRCYGGLEVGPFFSVESSGTFGGGSILVLNTKNIRMVSSSITNSSALPSSTSYEKVHAKDSDDTKYASLSRLSISQFASGIPEPTDKTRETDHHPTSSLGKVVERMRSYSSREHIGKDNSWRNDDLRKGASQTHRFIKSAESIRIESEDNEKPELTFGGAISLFWTCSNCAEQFVFIEKSVFFDCSTDPVKNGIGGCISIFFNGSDSGKQSGVLLKEVTVEVSNPLIFFFPLALFFPPFSLSFSFCFSPPSSLFLQLFVCCRQLSFSIFSF